MTRDDIIRMAREAGAIFDDDDCLDDCAVEIWAHFAALVAAAEREAIVKLVWNTPTQIDDEYVSPKDILTNAIRARGDA